MLAVILTILKIIGIILLCVVGLILLILLLVLFVPVRYEIHADLREPGETEDGKQEGIPDRLTARGGFSWLLHLFSGIFRYPAEGENGEIFVVKFAFFRLFPRRRKEQHRKDERPEPGTPEEGDDEAEGESGDEGGEPSEDKTEASAGGEAGEFSGDEAGESSEDKIEASSGGEAEESPEVKGVESAEDEGGESPEEEAGQRAPDGGAKNRRKWKKPSIPNPEIVIKKIYYTISGTYDKILYVRATVTSDIFSRAKERVLREVGRSLRHIIPRKCRVQFVYGAADPKSTADVMAKVYMLYPILEDRVQMVPVFDRETLAGTVRIRGRVMLVVPVVSFLRCYFNKDVRKLVRRMKKFGKDGRGGAHG